MRRLHALLLLAVSVLLVFPVSAARAESEAIVIRDWRVIRLRLTRRPRFLEPDPVLARYVVAGDESIPEAGDAEPGLGGNWKAARADEAGRLEHPALRNGYAFCTLDRDEAGTLLCSGKGRYVVYVNGVPTAGDVYGHRLAPTPIHLKKGTNRILVRVVRGRLNLKLERPDGELVLWKGDATLPDARRGRALNASGAVVLLNATDRVLDATIRSGGTKHFAASERRVRVAPRTLHKAPIAIRSRGSFETATSEVELPVTARAGGRTARQVYTLRVRDEEETYAQTFVSDMDRSVQYYGVRPPRAEAGAPMPLYLSLHGAGVRARGQVRAYSPKAGPVVAPTNRRRFGFDWEDWGRLDALEVLADVRRRFPIDPTRIYLTGHSMGGHGTWHIGATHPHLFAGIGPSAGWISFETYGGVRMRATGPAQELLSRGLVGSDTLALKGNLADLPIYILHGTADDNVPVSQARRMKKELEAFHRDFEYREVEGEKHWWDRSKAQGADCVDWPPMFDFFAHHRRPEAPRDLEFRTIHPGVSSTHYWIRVLDQVQPLLLTRVSARARAGLNRIELDTKNAARVAISLPPGFEGETVEILADEDELEAPRSETIHLARGPEGWRVSEPRSSDRKRPERYGPFKQAFQNGFVLVYGTGGEPEENAAAWERARFDAQVWWYRGNGACELLSDREFLDRVDALAGRNVILYGHAEMNAAFSACLDDSPIRVTRNRIEAGDEVYVGDHLSALIVRPRKGTANALVGIVAGTTPVGIRGTLAARYFRSGVQFPDFVIWGGPEPQNFRIQGAGYFGSDWSLEEGETWFADRWVSEEREEF